jgi:hypothetical protein
VATESAWSRFRHWRRSRPFWGGLFLLVSALELFLSANLTLKDLQVHIGETGYLSYVLPAVLMLCGALAWASPGQRLFYGIVGLLTALYSFLGLNLGGFGLGMLIGIVGGALVISWGAPPIKPAPAAPRDADADPDRDDVEAAPGLGGPSIADPPTSVLPGLADRDEPAVRPSADGGTPRKLLVITLVPVALTMALLAAGSGTPARAQPDCPTSPPSQPATANSARVTASRQTAPTKVPAPPANDPAAGPAAPTPAPAPSGSAPPVPAHSALAPPVPAHSAAGGTGNPIVDGWNNLVDGIGELLGIGADQSPGTSASPSPSPATTPSAPVSSASAPASRPTGPGAPTGSASGSPTPSLRDVPCLGPRVFQEAASGGVPSVSIRGGLLEGKSLNMYGSTYDGTVDLTTATGPLEVLKFSMDSSVTEPFSLTIPEAGGRTTVIKSNKLTTKGNVEFYTPSFAGKLFGAFPVTFTPDSPPPLMLPWLYFSDVRITLAFVSCDTLIAAPLSITELQ